MIARSAGAKPPRYGLSPARVARSSLYTLLSRMTVTIGKSLSGSKSLSVHVSFLSENLLLPNLFSVGRTDSGALLSRRARIAGHRFILPALAPGAAGGGGVAAL